MFSKKLSRAISADNIDTTNELARELVDDYENLVSTNEVLNKEINKLKDTESNNVRIINLLQSENEALRLHLADAKKIVDNFQDEINKLHKFKKYVHERLDDFDVPNDPEPENNKAHGCRIEGRLNWLFRKVCIAADRELFLINSLNTNVKTTKDEQEYNDLKRTCEQYKALYENINEKHNSLMMQTLSPSERQMWGDLKRTCEMKDITLTRQDEKIAVLEKMCSSMLDQILTRLTNPF